MILLTHAYFLNDDAKEQRIMKPYPPLGLLYVSAYLEEKSIEHEVFDTTFSTKTVFFEFLKVNNPSILAIYINLMTKLNVLEIIEFVRNNEGLNQTKIILGGPDVRYNAENLLNHGADFLVIGEGEETTYELIHSNLKADKLPGIAFKNEDGEIIINEERSLKKNLDDLPIPNRKKIDLNQYLSSWKKYHGENSLTLSTMRGCPYTCQWCSRGVYGLSYRRRSPEKVVEEIQTLQKEYNFDHIWFVDDVFTISHKWLEEFCKVLDSKQVKIAYECISRADRLNENVIKMLKMSGCFRIWIGAESGSQKIIDLMDRRVKVEQVQDMIQLSQKYGIEAGTFIMLGYPQETEIDIKNTLNHLKKANPKHFTITITYPIKGTELYEEVEAISTASTLNWSKTTDRDIDFKRPFSHKYYQYAMQWIVHEMAYFQRSDKKNNAFENSKVKLRALKARLGMILNK
ncbi:B12-binding domain-containing radical SAM protein [Emticicia sp. SJ17W-69]|uniref:B12-binding domain-containing radical SAM protein n=1 Tax=Emticicia sp. SJ17W-69 TaxID=3421657 RepID=UPI003EC054A9